MYYTNGYIVFSRRRRTRHFRKRATSAPAEGPTRWRAWYDIREMLRLDKGEAQEDVSYETPRVTTDTVLL